MKVLSEEAALAVAEAYGQKAGELSLGASQTIGQYLLPAFIAGFLDENPNVRITARSGNSDAILEALVAQDIQLALIEGPEQRKDIHLESFMDDQMLLVVPASHEWANQEINADDLKNEPLVMREFGSGSRRVVEQALMSIGLTPKELNISMELDQPRANLAQSKPDWASPSFLAGLCEIN